MRRFRTAWKFLTPGWLQRDQGERILYSLGLIVDAFAEAAVQSARLMLPSVAPSDALPLIAEDRGLLRGLFEPEASFRARLGAWRYPLGHRVRGSALALLEQVAATMRGTAWTTIDQRGTRYDRGVTPAQRGVAWNWDGASLLPNWARYWVVVKSTGAPWPTFDAGAWGPTVDADSSVSLAGSGVHPGEIAAVRTLTAPGSLSWTPAGRRAIYLVIYFAGQVFPAPDGTWGEWANRDDQYAYEPLTSAVT